MFATDYGDLGVFQSEFRRAYEVVEGLYNPKRAKEDYTVATTLEEVKALLERIRLDSPKRIAMDTEWGNDVARDEFRYTLSIQLAWSKGKAGFIQLRKHEERNKYYREEEYGKANKAGIKKTRSVLVDPGPLCGVRIYSKEDEQQVWNLVADLLRTPAIQLCGHHLRVDVEEFNRNGANIDEKLIDGFDTMLVHNVLYGDDSQGLDHLTRKYCPDYGAYWSELEAWLSSTGKRNYHLQFGYRDITLDILTKYGLLDADITWQVAEVLDKELEASPALKSYYYTIAAPTSLHLLDVERQGLLIDEQRRMEIREEYIPVYESLLADIRKMINWPDFSPSSKVQLAYLLFGESVKYKDWAKAALNCPKDVKLLKLTPLQNTDKYPRPWDDIVANGEEHLHTPSTKSNVLDILANTHKDIVEVKVLKHLSVIGKLISTYLVPITLNEFGVPQDGAGLHNNIRSDGRAITKLSQITETGRYTSSKANLQTWPKKQETAVIEALVWQKFKLDLKDYKAKCSSNEIPESDRIQAVKFKSIVIAPPGHSLIEVDFKNAELFLWAYCSGDKKLIDICTSGRDMHSEGTVSAFKITHLADELVIALEKLKKGDKEAYNAWSDKVKANYEALRTSYKAIIFGVIYGRGAPAVARELNKSGVNVSVADCEKIISNISDSYPVGWAWLQTNMDHAIEHGWVEIPGGRRRYFTGSKSLPRHIQSAIRREASNFGPQGEVALLLSKAGINFYNHRYKTDEGKAITYKLLLPIHDAFLIEVKDEHVTEMKRIIKECMSTNNKIPGTNYNLDVDIEVFKRWGEKEKK
jgi:DNA polymerase I-like protein with 3'-5' exonuclease and polymerase domains